MILEKIKKNIVLILVVIFVVVIFVFFTIDNNIDTSEKEEKTVVVEKFGDDGLHYITLTQKAANRLDIKIFTMGDSEIEELDEDEDEEDEEGEEEEDSKDEEDISELQIIPYASIIYGLDGRVWVYTSPKELTYVRREVYVREIDGNSVILENNIVNGINIVERGVMELFGTEFGMGGGH